MGAPRSKWVDYSDPVVAFRERKALVARHYANRHHQRRPSASGSGGGVTEQAGDVATLVGVNLTAVCIAGAQRTFLHTDVQRSFARHVHRPGYEYFVSVDKAAPWGEHWRRSSNALLISPIRAWIRGPPGEDYWNNDANRNAGVPCPTGTCNPHRFLLPVMLRLADCFYAIKHEQARRVLESAGELHAPRAPPHASHL